MDAHRAATIRVAIAEKRFMSGSSKIRQRAGSARVSASVVSHIEASTAAGRHRAA